MYTNSIFKLFQIEFVGLMVCDIHNIQQDEETHVFDVQEIILGSEGEYLRDLLLKVYYSPLENHVKCQCQMFEFKRILCRHSLTVLRRMRVDHVSPDYILDRWRKDLKRGYQNITNIYDSDVSEGERKRYNSLTPIIQGVQQFASKS